MSLKTCMDVPIFAAFALDHLAPSFLLADAVRLLATPPGGLPIPGVLSLGLAISVGARLPILKLLLLSFLRLFLF